MEKPIEKPIEKLYYGRFGNFESIKTNGKKCEAYLDKLEAADKTIQKLLEKDETLLDLYKTAMNSLEGIYGEEMLSHYVEAFRSGVLLGMDIMGAFDKEE